VLGHLDALEPAVGRAFAAHHERAGLDVDHLHGHAVAQVERHHAGVLVAGRRHGRPEAPVVVSAVAAAEEHARSRRCSVGVALPRAAAQDRFALREETREKDLHAAAEALHGNDVPRVAGRLAVGGGRYRDDAVLAIGDLLVLGRDRRGHDLLATVGSLASPRSSPSASSVTALDSSMIARCVLSATPFQNAGLPSLSP
jgi:hypothetical protein